MSFAEFTYPIMQAWDWWYMFHTKGIQMQIGGSDQYGNITAGISAVKYITNYHPNVATKQEAAAVGEPMGFTTPLLTTSSGQKFGKSAGNAIWLDNTQTSAFELYGYFLRTSDADVGKYLKMFTFMPIADIDALLVEHETSRSERKAQHKLASEFVELVHGAREAEESENQHRTLFMKAPVPLEAGAQQDGSKTRKLLSPVTPNNRPKANLKLPRSLIYQRSIGKILYAVGLVESASEGHRLANSHGAYIGGPPHKTVQPMPDGHISWSQISNWSPETTSQYLIHDDLLLFRRSKHNIRIVHVVSDEEYALSGEQYPGMEQAWRTRMLKAMSVKEDITSEEKENVMKMLKEEDSRRVLAGEADAEEKAAKAEAASSS